MKIKAFFCGERKKTDDKNQGQPEKIFLLDFLRNLWTSFIMKLREGMINMKKMRKRFIPALSIAFSLAISVPAFAQHIYIGDTETVISYDENGNKVITLIFDPAKTPDYMKPDSPNYWRKEEQAQTEQSADVSAFPQTGQAADFTAQPEEPPFQPIPPLTEAPEVGTVLANIQQEDENGEMKYTKPYQSYGFGQCTWYAGGRFYEVHGINLPIYGNAKEWIDTTRWSEAVQVVTDISAVPEQSVAIYAPRWDESLAGHVCFIEYVERDADGKPLNIYYTDANGKQDTEKNVYTPDCDGAVIKEDFETFKGSKHLKLIGYITMK